MRGLFLNRRFLLLLLGCILALVAAYVYPGLFPWVAVLLFVGGALVVADGVLLFGFGPRLAAGREVAEKLSNGEENRVKIWVKNKYPFGIRLRILDEIPVQFQRRDLAIRSHVAAGERKEFTYALHPVRRGEYGFGRIRVFASTPFSFLERRYSFEKERTLAVYPSFVAMRKAEMQAFAERRAGTNRKVRVASVSTTFDQIKPYVPGDDPRAVNWKATAKCDKLMVNSYMEERSQQVYCLIDKGRTMQSPFHGMTLLDYSINAALALSNVILKKGDRAGLFTFSNKPGGLIRADSRPNQLSRICEALYNQRTHFQESDFEQLCLKINKQVPNRSLLVLFTNFDTVSGMRRQLPALLRLAKSHLLLVVLFEDTEVSRVADEPAESLKDVYFKTIAGSFLLGKKQIAAELCKAGIRTMLTQPEHLTMNAVNGYLELKERGWI